MVHTQRLNDLKIPAEAAFGLVSPRILWARTQIGQGHDPVLKRTINF